MKVGEFTVIVDGQLKFLSINDIIKFHKKYNQLYNNRKVIKRPVSTRNNNAIEFSFKPELSKKSMEYLNKYSEK
jgi:hypothetical protein